MPLPLCGRVLWRLSDSQSGCRPALFLAWDSLQSVRGITHYYRQAHGGLACGPSSPTFPYCQQVCLSLHVDKEEKNSQCVNVLYTSTVIQSNSFQIRFSNNLKLPLRLVIMFTMILSNSLENIRFRWKVLMVLLKQNCQKLLLHPKFHSSKFCCVMETEPALVENP